jgi:aspartate/methionine/tyrosine aminotransferase
MHTPLIPGTWQYDLKSLGRLLEGDVKCLVINTPQRPNGELVADIDQIAQLVRPKRGLVTISDEIFSHIVYDGKRHVSVSSVDGMADRTIVIDTFSKTYGMTGWRIGWTVAPAPLVQRFSMFLQDSITNVATFVQRAALAAITGPQDWVDEKLACLQRKRDAMVGGLNSIAGIRCPTPSGSFYAFADVSKTGMTAEEFTRRLLHERQVAVVSGTAFGSQGEGFVRLTFAVPDEDIEAGLEGIASMLRN